MKLPKRLLTQKITLYPYEGEGAYNPVFGDPIEVRARVNYENKLVRSRHGSEEVSNSSLLLAADVAGVAVPGSRVVLPEDTADYRTIESGGPVMGMRGISHVRVDLV